ncbi:MAG: Hsp20/alpha crystallin family protein [Candidatus Omnitrophota bacterium]
MRLIPHNNKHNSWMDPFFEMENIQKQMNDLFNLSLSRGHAGDMTLLGSQWIPSVDIYDSRENILVKADLPGLKKDEIEVTIEDDNLVLKGEKKKESEVREENCFRTERFYGSFYRTIALPNSVDASKVEAKYHDGVLTLTLPKKEESKPKRISVDIH